jgi:diguanylate cyclase
MIKILNKLFSKNDTELDLTEEQKNNIKQEIAYTNMRHIKSLAIVTIVIELLLILLMDIPNIQGAEDHNLWLYQSYLALHSFIILVCLVGFFAVSYFQKHQSEYYLAVSNKLVIVLAVLLLSSVAVITGLDQHITGQITAYVALILIVSIVFLVPWPTVLYVYGIPHATLITSLMVFQEDPVLLQANIANSTIFLLTIMFISSLLYNKSFMIQAKNLLLLEKNEKLDYLARHDELTGIYNRRYFMDLAQVEVEKRNCTANNIMLVLIDIDHFKQVNDTYGHPAGDRVIQEFVTTLKKGIRNGDYIARWGGEEFILLLPNISMPEAKNISNRLREMIEETVIEFEDFLVQATASFGLSEIDCSEGNFITSFSKAYSLADKALYQAKESGRNKVVVCSSMN